MMIPTPFKSATTTATDARLRQNTSTVRPISLSSQKRGCKNIRVESMTGPRAVSIFPFEGLETDELCFVEGSFIQLIERVNDQWYRGCIQDRQGIFPISFVKVLEDVPVSRKKVLEKWMKCTSRYDGSEPDDLSLLEGDIIEVIGDVGSGWLRGRRSCNYGDVTGIFPANFCEPCDSPKISSRELTKKIFGNKPVPSAKPSFLVKRSSSQWVKCTCRFDGSEPDDLSLLEGDIVEVIEDVGSGWLRGRRYNNSGDVGIFPADFCDHCDAPESILIGKPSSEHIPSSDHFSKPHPRKCWLKSYEPQAIVLYDFDAESSKELTIRDGEYIRLLEFVSSDWLHGENIDGESGIFPVSFVNIVVSVGSTVTPNKRSKPPALLPSLSKSNNVQVKATVLFAHTSSQCDELTVVVGDIVEILYRISSDWVMARLNDLSGMLPLDFIRVTCGSISSLPLKSPKSNQQSPSVHVEEHAVVSSGRRKAPAKLPDVCATNIQMPLLKKKMDENEIGNANRARLWNCERNTDLNYVAADCHADSTPKDVEASISALSEYLVGPFRGDTLMMARTIARWVATHISYDVVSFVNNRIPDQSAGNTLRHRKSVCAGYSELTKALCEKAGVKCRIITGVGKNMLQGGGHAWNAIFVDEQWELVDTCWMAGSTDVQLQSFSFDWKPWYFCAPPTWFSYDHYPSAKNDWLLREPPSKLVQETRVIASGRFFSMGARFISHAKATIDSNDGNVIITLGIGHAKGVSGNLTGSGVSQPVLIQPHVNNHNSSDDDDDRVVDFIVSSVSPGQHQLHIFASEESSEKQMQFVLHYNICFGGAGSGVPLTYSLFEKMRMRIMSPRSATLSSGYVDFEVQCPANTPELSIYANSSLYTKMTKSRDGTVRHVRVRVTGGDIYLAVKAKYNSYEFLAKWKIH